MATLRNRGEFQWEAQIRKKGFPTQNRTFNTKADAEKWARMVESEMDRGIFRSTAEAEKTTLSQALARYQEEVLPTKKGQAADKSRIRTLTERLGGIHLAALTSAKIASFRDSRLKEVSAQSVIHEINLLNRILKTAVIDWGITLPAGIPTTLIRKPKKPQGRDRRPTQEEIDNLLDASESNELRGIVLLAVETAMRRGEITKLKWDFVDLRKPTVRLIDTKNGENREIPLSSRAIKILQDLPRRIDGNVFSLRPDSVTQAFERACKRAGIEDLRFHDLRHEAASRLFEKGLNPMEVAAITGHKTLQMLKRYTHLKAEDLAKKLG